jgi:PAS domain S-box-containing protein
MTATTGSDDPIPRSHLGRTSLDFTVADVLIGAFENADEGMFIVSRDGTLYANLACARFAGTELNDLLRSESVLERLAENDARAIRAYLNNETDGVRDCPPSGGTMRRWMPFERDGVRYVVGMIRSAAPESDSSREERRQSATLRTKGTVHTTPALDGFHEAIDSVLTDVMDVGNFGLVQLDASGLVLRANQAFRQMIGYTEEELTHLTIRDWTHPEDGDAVRAFEQLVKGQIPSFHGEKRFRAKDHRTVWGRLLISSAHNKDGRFLYAIAMVVDITEYRRAVEALRDSRQRYKSLVDSIEGVVWEADPTTFRFRFVSPQAERLFGYPLERWYSSENFWKVLLREEDYDTAVRSCLDAIRGHRSHAIEYRVRTADGRVVWVRDIVTVVVKDGVVDGLCGILVDITDRREAEDALRRLADELEQRVIERTSELSARNEELRRSNADLQDFTYAVSHDLQEPLRMVTSYVQLLERRFGEKWDHAGRDFFRYALDGAQRMETMIASLLDYGRIGAMPLTLAPTDCERLLAFVRLDLERRVAESGTVLTNEPLPTLSADSAQLLRVFTNLVANAIKFRSAENPFVHVAARRGDGEWVFFVRDNGIGIDPRHHERIFSVFQRLHTRTEYDGTGIGLAVCKKIVERHGGRIWVESAPQHGSTFYFTIPDK